ncbi:MAG: putative C-S lyase [Chloroflexi bacterium]|nr:putative C-S lyase [Chloroflexota bacterium]
MSTTTRIDFDRIVERRGTDSIKWSRYGDALPLWVADMDFPSSERVIEALRRRIDHGVFGYGTEPAELRAVVQERLQRLYNWQVDAEEFLFLPGVVVGFNLVCRSVGEAGDGVIVQTPAYPPFFAAPTNGGRSTQLVPLVRTAGGYEIDFDAFEQAITPRTRVFLFCNPHNPTGRVFSRAELETLAEICIRHDLVICSDEIHQDFIYPGSRHIPIASLGPEVADRTVTLISPSKTYNIAGFHFSIALVKNPALRARLRATGIGLLHYPGLLDYVAGCTAYKEGGEWLAQVREYLRANRDAVVRFVREHLPGVTAFEPEGTYLAWLDCRGAVADGKPGEFFLKEANVALSEGVTFGKDGEGFVRLNFACSRSILESALNRMREALARQ